MRVAMVVPGGVDRSGETRVIPAVLALIRRLAALHDLHVIALKQEARPGEWELLGATVHNVGLRHNRLNAMRSIRALHRRAPFDVVQSLWSGTCGWIGVTAGRLLGVPCPVHIAGGELIALHDIGYGGRLTWRGRWREALTLRGATAITAASKPIIDSIAALGYRARRLPLGVDLDLWPPCPPKPRLRGEKARLIHVASLNGVKDQATLLRALARLDRDYELDVVGEDTLNGAVQALARDLGVNVRFHGLLNRSQMRPLMERAHLMILTSRHEAGPLAVLEAAVAGVPTVGTAVGHLTEWAPDAASVVPVGDSNALAISIRRVLDDDSLRLSLAREAAKRAVAEDADFTAREFDTLYQHLCGGRA